MNFNLTEERQMLQDTLRRFMSGAQEMSSDALWTRLAELGVIGALFDEEQGGYGGAGFDLSVVFEELGRAGLNAPLCQTGILAGGLIAQLGDEAQRAMVEQIIAGELQCAFAHAEPRSRYQLNCVSTTAVASGDGYVLNGHKAVVLNGGQSQQIVVSARTTGDVTDSLGISLFVLCADHPGLQRRSYVTVDGVDAAEIYLLECQVPASALLGEAGAAFEAIEYQSARACAALCAEALGNMESAKNLTVEYLKTRKQFGVAIGKFQALQHRMADVLIEIEQARSAVINICGNLEQPRNERERQVSAAKNLIGRVGRIVAEESIQLHGGIGMTQEYVLGRMAKRLVMIDHEMGDSDHHLERFIALSRQQG